MDSLRNFSTGTNGKSKNSGHASSRSTTWKPGCSKLSDDELRAKTAAWKDELSKIEDKDELARKLNEILPEAFAVVKNACRRLTERKTDVMVREHPLRWEMIPFDVQLIGGIGLHNGKIAEMATGEGKTLVGTLPVYLNALTGRGVHVVTVNDYLASRDSEWMGAIYKFLGLTVGCILNNQDPSVRRAAICLRHHLRHERRIWL